MGEKRKTPYQRRPCAKLGVIAGEVTTGSGAVGRKNPGATTNFALDWTAEELGSAHEVALVPGVAGGSPVARGLLHGARNRPQLLYPSSRGRRGPRGGGVPRHQGQREAFHGS